MNQFKLNDVFRKMKLLGHQPKKEEEISSNIYMIECDSCDYYSLIEDLTDCCKPTGSGYFLSCPGVSTK